MQRMLEEDAGKLASACHEHASAPATPSSRKLAHAVRNGLNGAKLHLELVRRDLLELGAAQHTLDALRTVERQLDHTAQLLNQPADAAASRSVANDETRD